MRLVLDTNTALPGLLWGGPPGPLIDAALEGRVELASSLPLLAELQGVLSRPKFGARLAQGGLTVSDVFDGRSPGAGGDASGHRAHHCPRPG